MIEIETQRKDPIPFTPQPLILEEVAEKDELAQIFESSKTSAPLPFDMGNTVKRPHLEAPSQNLSSILDVEEEIYERFLPRNGNQEIGEDKHLPNEVVLFLIYMNCMKKEQENREVGAELHYRSVQGRQERNKVIQKEYFSKKDDLIKNEKTDKKLGWASWILWGGLAAGGVASLALTIASGGAALPVILAVASGVLGVSSGSTTIAQGVIKHENQKAIGELTGLETERHLNSDRIRTEVQEIKESFDAVAKILDELIEAIRKKYSATMAK